MSRESTIAWHARTGEPSQDSFSNLYLHLRRLRHMSSIAATIEVEAVADVLA